LKDYLLAVVLAYIAFLTPIRDYILISEVMICGNYVLFSYVKKQKSKKEKYPLWLLIFASFIAIISTRLMDIYIAEDDIFCDKTSKAICYYQLYLISKNVGLILGFDLTKTININFKQNKKNEND
tara:strand:- start:9170 stop:9544 length:375 start_codon:yes stop_codon:yes gene_type:complete